MLKTALRRLGGLASSILVVFCLCGCKGTEYGSGFEPIWMEITRHVTMFAGIVSGPAVYPYREDPEAPVHVAAVVGVNGDYFKDFVDAAHNQLRDPYFTTIEIDFGDGSGWFDATADSKTKWVYNGLYGPAPDFSNPEHTTQHTYTTPGDYTIRARVTYWDGEVVYADGGLYVKVLPTGSAS